MSKPDEVMDLAAHALRDVVTDEMGAVVILYFQESGRVRFSCKNLEVPQIKTLLLHVLDTIDSATATEMPPTQ